MNHKKEIKEGFYSNSTNYWIGPDGKFIKIEDYGFPLSDHAVWAVTHVLKYDPKTSSEFGIDKMDLSDTKESLEKVYKKYSGRGDIYIAMILKKYVRGFVSDVFDHDSGKKRRTLTLDLGDREYANQYKKYLSHILPKILTEAIKKEWVVTIDLINKTIYNPPVFESKKLSEAPIDTYSTIGDFSKGKSFRGKADRAIITHPTAVQKVKDFFKNTKVDFDFYFVNSKEGTRHFDKGEVKEDFLYKEEGLNIKKEQLKGGKINDNNITVFFGNNIGDSKIPMTPWIMAHRFGHAIRRIYTFEKVLGKETQEFLYSVLEDFYGIKRPPMSYGMRETDRKYDIALKNLCQEIGTFKSARDKNIVRQYEYHFELLAQYLKNGKVTFNDLPDNLVIGHAAFGRKVSVSLKNKEESHQFLEIYFERTYPYYVEDVLSECVGKIFIM